MPTGLYRRTSQAFLLTLVSACAGTSPTVPDPATANTSPVGASSIRVNGLPETLAPGSTAQLKAEVARGGTVKECAAAWSVDDAAVAVVSASGFLTAKTAGYARVVGSCEGLTTAVETRVETMSPYRLMILPHDSEVQTDAGVMATMTFLDGPRVGQTASVGSIYSEGFTGVMWPTRVRFTAEGYATREFVLTESTGSRRNSISNLYDYPVPMTFTPDALTDTYVRTLSSTQGEMAHPFSMRVPGPVEIRTWWSVDVNDRLFIELWCGGRMLGSTSQSFGSAGTPFTLDAQAGGCEIRVRQFKSDAATRYRVAIRYAR